MVTNRDTARDPTVDRIKTMGKDPEREHNNMWLIFLTCDVKALKLTEVRDP